MLMTMATENGGMDVDAPGTASTSNTADDGGVVTTQSDEAEATASSSGSSDGRGGYQHHSTVVVPAPAHRSGHFEVGGGAAHHEDDDDEVETSQRSSHGDTAGQGAGEVMRIDDSSDDYVDPDEQVGQLQGQDDCEEVEGVECDDEDDDDRTSYSYESEYSYDYGDDDDDDDCDDVSDCDSSSSSSVLRSSSAAVSTPAVLPQCPSPFHSEVAKGGDGDGMMAAGRRGGGNRGGAAISILDDLLRKCDELFPEAMGTGGMDAGEYRTFLDLRSGHLNKSDGDYCEGDGDVKRTSSPAGAGENSSAHPRPSLPLAAGPETTCSTTTTPSSPNRQEGDGDDDDQVVQKGGGDDEMGGDVFGLGGAAAASSKEATSDDGDDGKWHHWTTPKDGDVVATAATMMEPLFTLLDGLPPPSASTTTTTTTTTTDEGPPPPPPTNTKKVTTSTMAPASSSAAKAAAAVLAAAASSKRTKEKKYDMASLVFSRFHGRHSDTKLAESMKTAEGKQREADSAATTILRSISDFLLTRGSPDNVDVGIVLLSLKMSRGFNRMVYSTLRNLESFADAGERADLYHSVLDVVDRLADGDLGGGGGGGGGVGGKFLSGFLLHDLLEGDRPNPSSGGGSSSCAALLSALAPRAGTARDNQESLIRGLTNGKVRDVEAEVRTARDAIGVCDRLERVAATVWEAIMTGRSMGILPPEEEDDEDDEEKKVAGAEYAADLAVDRGGILERATIRRPSSTCLGARSKAREMADPAEEGAGNDESSNQGSESTHKAKTAGRTSGRGASASSAASAAAAAAADSEYCRLMESHRFASVPIVSHLQIDDDQGESESDRQGTKVPSSTDTKVTTSTTTNERSTTTMTTTMSHHYAREIGRSRGEALPPKRLVRIHRELSVLSHDLPVEVGSSIFLRVDEDRPDVMKACVVGPAGTPYENGIFVFDVWLPSDYPNVPPMCHLITTGGNRVRFNPNLYMDGKVCLSLLGTWSGPSWIPGTSTLLQVLVSIQSLILVPDPYFNEPGMDRNRDGMDKASDLYNRKIRAATLKVAILEQLMCPPPGFEDCVLDHFRLRRGRLVEQLAEWRESAEDEDAKKKAEMTGDDSSPRALAAKREIAFRCMDGGLRSSPDEVREICEKIEACLGSLMEGCDSAVKSEKAT